MIQIFALDNPKPVAAAETWRGVQEMAAAIWGCCYDAVDTVVTDDAESIATEWLLVDGGIVGSLDRPASLGTPMMLAAE